MQELNQPIQTNTTDETEEWITFEEMDKLSDEDLKTYIQNTKALKNVDIEHELKTFDTRMFEDEEYAMSLVPDVEFTTKPSKQLKYL